MPAPSLRRGLLTTPLSPAARRRDAQPLFSETAASGYTQPTYARTPPSPPTGHGHPPAWQGASEFSVSAAAGHERPTARGLFAATPPVAASPALTEEDEDLMDAILAGK